MLLPFLKNNAGLGTALLYSVAVHLALFAISSSDYFSSQREYKKPDTLTYQLSVKIQANPSSRQASNNNDSHLVKKVTKPADRPAVKNAEPDFHTVRKASNNTTKSRQTTPPLRALAPQTPVPEAEMKSLTEPEKNVLPQSNPQQLELAAIQSDDKTLTQPPAQLINLLPPILKAPPPFYPEEARWEERTGRVTLRFHISTRGLARDIQIAKTSGHPDLDRAALITLKRWRFDASKLSEPMGWHTYSFRFKLD